MAQKTADHQHKFWKKCVLTHQNEIVVYWNESNTLIFTIWLLYIFVIGSISMHGDYSMSRSFSDEASDIDGVYSRMIFMTIAALQKKRRKKYISSIQKFEPSKDKVYIFFVLFIGIGAIIFSACMDKYNSIVVMIMNNLLMLCLIGQYQKTKPEDIQNDYLRRICYVCNCSCC